MRYFIIISTVLVALIGMSHAPGNAVQIDLTPTTPLPATATAQAEQAARIEVIAETFSTQQRADLRLLRNRVQITGDDDVLIVTAAFDETTANTVLDTFVNLAGYTAEQSSLELQDGGVLTTITNAWNNQTLQFWTTGALDDDDSIDLVVEWATLNGQPIGLNPFVLAEFMMEFVVTEEITTRLDTIFADLDTLDYRMIRAYVNENAIIVDAEVIVTPVITPTATPAG